MKKAGATILLLLIAVLSLAAEADTLRFTPKKMKRPALATGLSAVFPGGGQMYNGKWAKSLVFLGAETGLAATAGYYYYGFAYYRDLYGENSVSAQSSLTTAKRFTWFFAAVWVYSLIDAYVDAHLSAFPDERLILEPDTDMRGLRLSYNF